MKLEQILRETKRIGKRALVGSLILGASILSCDKKKESPLEPVTPTTIVEQPQYEKNIITQPIERIISTEPSENINIYQGETSQGQISFLDNSNEEEIVPVQVIDETTQQPIETEMQITYTSGENSQVFKAFDPNERFLPTMRVLTNSISGKPTSQTKIHTLKTVPVEKGVVYIQTLEEEGEKQVLQRWEASNEDLGWWEEMVYRETIDETEIIKRGDRSLAIIRVIDLLSTHILGALLPISFEKLAGVFDPYVSISDVKSGGRWDVYERSYGTKYRDTTGDVELIPSNVPTITINEPEINGNNVVISWKAFDDTVYSQPGLLNKQDLTVLLGETLQPDLLVWYNLFKDSEIFRNTDLTNPLRFQNLPEGKYYLQMQVQDEVRNWSLEDLEFRIEDIAITDPENLIAFMSNKEDPTDLYKYHLYTIREDGSDERRLRKRRGDRYPTWSPDKSKLAFSSANGISIMNPDGTGLEVIRYMTNKFPSIGWSPVGDKLIFDEKRSSYNRDIFIFDLITRSDKENETRLTYNFYFDEEANSMVSRKIMDFQPSWSPNGSKVVFTSNENTGRTDIFDIYTMDIDGSNRKRLTNGNEESNEHTNRLPKWSPDGKRIVFETYRDGNFEIYIMNADGSNQINLTNHSGTDHYPSWSPDGGKIAFTSPRDGRFQIHTMYSSGEYIGSITSGEYYSLMPSWSSY